MPAAAAAEPDDGMTRTASLLALPLLPPPARLATNLIPDACTPAARALLAHSDRPAHPSYLRRARPVTHGAHYSWVTPLPTPFPYAIPVIDDADADAERRIVHMETFLTQWDIAADDARREGASSGLELFIPPARNDAPPFAPFRLLGISPTALPQLDMSSTRQHILAHSSKPSARETVTSGPGVPVPPPDSDAWPRWALGAVLSGHGIAACLSSSSSKQDVEGVGVAFLESQDDERKAEATQSASSARDSVLRRLDALAKRQAQAASSDKEDAGDIMPWAQAYAGHQFGDWAGQLGDGRATSLFEIALPTPITSTPAFPRDPALTQPHRTDIQLKGAGRTPYSRFADGLATLQSSLREFLCAEYMGGGLGIESCRGLAVGVFTTPLGDDGQPREGVEGVRVRRERWHPSAVMTRLAPSWVRIGSFELHASRGEWESVRVLGEYAVRHLFQYQDLVLDHPTQGNGTQEGEKAGDTLRPWALRLARDVAVRNAKTIARWQVAGFMHGVMNTDNIALLGHTIDYGPYAFMDLFDEDCICNHSDSLGRYAYKMQPSMGLFALSHLVLALSPLIDFEERHGRAPRAGELARLEEAGEGELEALSEVGEEVGREDVKALFMRVLLREWTERWLGRLGLAALRRLGQGEGPSEGDNVTDDGGGGGEATYTDNQIRRELIDPLLVVLERLDFATHLRRLADFPALLHAKGVHSLPSNDADGDAETNLPGAIEQFVETWRDETHVRSYERAAKREATARWLRVYARYLFAQGRPMSLVREEMLKTNPRFVLRNWITTEVAERVEKQNDTAFLERVLQMCLRPFEAWGAPREGVSKEALAEENRLCSLGTPLEGHLPSCSS